MRRRDEGGQTTVLIIGFATTILMALVVVVNASAAFLQRQELDNLADGAALYGADLGSAGVYEEGIPEDRLLQTSSAVRAAVLDYLSDVGARARYPGLTPNIRVDASERTVTVTLSAPVDLPLSIPGAPSRPRVGASSTAAVQVVP